MTMSTSMLSERLWTKKVQNQEPKIQHLVFHSSHNTNINYCSEKNQNIKKINKEVAKYAELWTKRVKEDK